MSIDGIEIIIYFTDCRKKNEQKNMIRNLIDDFIDSIKRNASQGISISGKDITSSTLLTEEKETKNKKTVIKRNNIT